MGKLEDKKYLEVLEARKAEFVEIETVVENTKDVYSLTKEQLAEFLTNLLSQEDVVGVSLHTGQDIKVVTRKWKNAASLISEDALKERNPNAVFVEIVECPKCRKRFMQKWATEPRKCTCGGQTLFLGGSQWDKVANGIDSPEFTFWLTNLKFE